MNDQCKSPTIEEIQADFIRAVREGDRVTVSKVNAIGGWDSSHFNPRDIRVTADELDRLRAENERLREALEKITGPGKSYLNDAGNFRRCQDEARAVLKTDGGKK